jgi:general secretion pathway protein C
MGSTPLGTALAVDVGGPSVDAALVARALGARATGGVAAPASDTAAPATESGRFALLGVLAGRNAQGAALVAVDGKAAKPFVVGAALVDGWTLQSVQGRHAVLARGGAALALELPPQGLAIKGGIKP